MTDTITILTSRGPLLTKTWKADGSLKPYDRAKTFSVREEPVSDIRALARCLERIAPDPMQCVIRGTFIDNQSDASRDHTTRDLEHFREAPHQWVCFDVDGFEPVLADPLSEPAEAVREFIETKLPLEFTGASHFWQLSSSAGRPGKEEYLKCHVWFWLTEPVAGSVLEAWARHGQVPVDKTVFRTVQVHYTAAPVFEQGVTDPVCVRSSFVATGQDEVRLVLPADWERWAELTHMPDGLPGSTAAARRLSDPGLKSGVIGSFCRAYSPHRIIDELLPQVFEFEDDDNVRVTWHGGGGSPGGCCITDDQLHFYNSHDSDPFAGRAINAWDMCRHYMFGALDGDDPSVYEFAGPGALPSHGAMRDYARGLPDVQAELLSAATDTAPASPAADVSELPDMASLPGGRNELLTPAQMVPRHEAALAAVAVPEQLQRALDAIERCHVADDLETRLAANLRDAEWSDSARNQIVHALQARSATLTGARLPVATVRGWMAPVAGAAGWTDITAEGRVLGTKGNVREILRRMGATVRYNTMRKADEILLPGKGFTIDNQDNVALTHVLSECNSVDMKINVSTLKSYINLIAEENQYNPPLEWIESKAWDGVDRLPSWYATIKSANEPLKPLLMLRWALQCVAILHNTGDTMARAVLTFTGPQYMGKSRWFKSLAPEGMVCVGHLLDVHDKDSIKIAIGYWITELGELDSTFKKSDLAALKAFISNLFDEQRLPYAPGASKFPRRTSFAATVNLLEFLRDATGNTRYWAIEALEANADHGIDMQQLWAQVLALWKGGEVHWLTPDEMARLNESNEDFTATDSLDELVRTKLAWNDPAATWQWSTATQIAGLIGAQNDRSAVTRLSSLVAKMNGNQRKRQPHTGARLLRVPVLDAYGDT